MINSVYSNQLVSNSYNIQKSYTSYNNVSNLNVSTYKSDSLSLSNTTPIVPKEPPYGEPTDPVPYEPYKPSFFDRGEVRLAGIVLGGGAVGAGVGAAVGSAFGRVGLGAGIGAGVGVVAPIALLAYALWSWGRNH